MTLKIEFGTRGDLYRFDNMLKSLSGPDFNRVVVNAINRVGDMAYSGRGAPSVVRTLAKQTGLPQRVIKKAVAKKKASYSDFTYRLRATGGDISLKHFKARETRKGVTAAPFGKRTLFEGNFIKGGHFPNRKTAKGLNGHVFEPDRSESRWGRGAELIKSGVIIPQQMLEGETAEGFNEIVSKNLPRRFDHELNRILGL